MGDLRLTTRGRVVLYCLGAIALIALMIWADSAMQIPGVDDARVDAEQLQ